MAEEGLSTNSDRILIEKGKNDLINLQIKFIEEKEKNLNFEKNNILLENELREMDKKIEKINLDHKNEIEEIKLNFQKLINKGFQQLKNEYDRKDEKTNSLEEEIKEPTDLFEIKIGDLFKLNYLNWDKYVDFVKIKNKWKEIDDDYSKCCDKNCINTDEPIGYCIKGNGFGNLISDENIKYINCLEGKEAYNKSVFVYAKNSFNKPQNCFNYSLYYFEIKCIFGGELNEDRKYLNIGLENYRTNEWIEFCAEYALTMDKYGDLEPATIVNNNDILGCGLVYPPTNKMNEELPYVFCTQNGKQIGKVSLIDISASYKPFIKVECCSIEANFGNDLKTKPFKYDISKQLLKDLIKNLF